MFNPSAVKVIATPLQALSDKSSLLGFLWSPHIQSSQSARPSCSISALLSPCLGPPSGCWVSDTLHSAQTQLHAVWAMQREEPRSTGITGQWPEPKTGSKRSLSQSTCCFSYFLKVQMMHSTTTGPRPCWGQPDSWLLTAVLHLNISAFLPFLLVHTGLHSTK